MKQLEGFRLWVFAGGESKQVGFASKPIVQNLYYIGHEPGDRIEAGPFLTEWQAEQSAKAMTDTRGT